MSVVRIINYMKVYHNRNVHVRHADLHNVSKHSHYIIIGIIIINIEYATNLAQRCQCVRQSQIPW